MMEQMLEFTLYPEAMPPVVRCWGMVVNPY